MKTSGKAYWVVKITFQHFWDNKKVLITGATGLLGSHLVPELINKKAKITVLIRDIVPDSLLIKDKFFQKVNFVFGKLEELQLLIRLVNEYEIDTVFHLGAQTQVTIANSSPLSTFESNIKGTWTLLEACRILGNIKRIIIASTDKVYGTHVDLPYTEEHELRGIHPYDVSKVCADLISQSYFKTYNLPLAITRCGNIYGPGDLNFNRIIPETIKAIIDNKPPIIRSDGKFIRDYIFIKDIVDAYLLVAEKIEKKEVIGEIFNFSSGNKLTVIELVNIILKITGSNLKPKVQNIAKNEIREQSLSCKKAKKILNWIPKYSIDKGLKETYEWYKNEYFPSK